MNKYEENISDIITLDATEEIVDIFLESLEKTDNTTGIIANKELIEYTMGEALAQDWINVRRVDIEVDDLEYMLSVDDDGDLVVQPVSDFKDRYFSSMETVYISMDGDVSQDVIDNCVDRDVNVILFGYEEDCDCDECQCACTDKDTDDSESTHISRDKHGNPLGFSKSWSTVRDGVHCYSSYSHYSSDVNMLRSIASDFGVKL